MSDKEYWIAIVMFGNAWEIPTCQVVLDEDTEDPAIFGSMEEIREYQRLSPMRACTWLAVDIQNMETEWL